MIFMLLTDTSSYIEYLWRRFVRQEVIKRRSSVETYFKISSHLSSEHYKNNTTHYQTLIQSYAFSICRCGRSCPLRSVSYSSPIASYRSQEPTAPE